MAHGYNDPRYYAGMLKLAPTAFDRELEYAAHAHPDRVTTIEAGRRMASEPSFSASFADSEYGLSWWHHAKFHGHVSGSYR